jgi:hypothetical protein
MLPGAPDLPPEGAYHPEVRCCSYHPHLAAHLVGGVLGGEDGEGRARVRSRIAARVGVTPLGLGPTPAYYALKGRFGHSREMLCAFYQNARCTIWRHRAMPCASFHCKFDRGAIGRDLWSFLIIASNVIERVLARWLLGKLGLEVAPSDALLRAPEDAALDRQAWGGWFGREEEYFLESARLVDALSYAEVEAIGGRDLQGLAEALRGVVARGAELPERVRVNGEIVHHLGRPGYVRLQNRGLPLDLLEVPEELMARLSGEMRLADLGLDEDLARKLVDWQVLIS